MPIWKHKHAIKYPKWENGIPQMVFWGMRKGGSGHRNKGAELEFWGVEGREMGFIGLVTRPKLGETGEKDNPFLQFSGHKNSIIFRYKTREKHTQTPLSRHCIECRLPTHCNHPSLHFHNDFYATTEPLCHALRICICNLQQQKMSFCHAVVSEKGVI